MLNIILESIDELSDEGYNEFMNSLDDEEYEYVMSAMESEHSLKMSAIKAAENGNSKAHKRYAKALKKHYGVELDDDDYAYSYNNGYNDNSKNLTSEDKKSIDKRNKRTADSFSKYGYTGLYKPVNQAAVLKNHSMNRAKQLQAASTSKKRVPHTVRPDSKLVNVR